MISFFCLSRIGSDCGGENSEPIYGASADYTSRVTYTNQLENINSKNTSYGDITLGVNLNLVRCIGFDISFGILINLDNATQSGIFFTGGFVIPFDTPEQREKSMNLYYEHH